MLRSGRYQLQATARCSTASRSSCVEWWHYGPSSQYGVACSPSHAALRAPRERYHMFQLVGWAGIKPALLLFLSVFTDARRCLFPRFPPSAEMGAPCGNASAVASMASSHVGLPSTSRNALTGAGLTGCCAGRPLAETPGRRRQRNKLGWHGRYPRGNAPSAARSA